MKGMMFFLSAAVALAMLGFSCNTPDLSGPVVPVGPDEPQQRDTIQPGPTPPAQEQIGTCSSQIYVQNSEGYPIFRIPAAVTTKAGTILCFCEGREAYSDNGNIDMVVKRSVDHGKTWSPLTVIADAGTDRYGNPVPIVLDDGTVMLVFGWSVASSSSSTKVFYCTSKDDGVSWSTPVEITSQVKVPTRTKYQTGPVHGIVKQRDPHKGRIIVPVYGTSSNGTPSGVFWSDDNGASWHPGGSVDYKYGGEPTVTERGDGSLIINMRDNNSANPYRYQAVSSDGGQTWGTVQATQLIEPNGCEGALLTYSLGTTAKSSVLLFSNPNHTESRRHGSVKISRDGGSNWTAMYQYTKTTTYDMYSSYSDLVIVGGDVIGVVYEAGYKNNYGIRFKSFGIDEIKEPYTGQNKQ